MGDRDDPDDVMETSLTIDYDKQWLNCVSAIGPLVFRTVIIKNRINNYSSKLIILKVNKEENTML